jgi:hypothetical protein
MTAPSAHLAHDVRLCSRMNCWTYRRHAPRAQAKGVEFAGPMSREPHRRRAYTGRRVGSRPVTGAWTDGTGGGAETPRLRALRYARDVTGRDGRTVHALPHDVDVELLARHHRLER